MSDPNEREGDAAPTSSRYYVLQVRRGSGDTWHNFESLSDAAAYALEIMRVLVDGQTYPIAIWRDRKKLWKPFGQGGKLHYASTREALESLSREPGA